MSDCFKSSLISLGIGMAAGVYIATNNKKIQNFVKDTQSMIEEKFDSAKQGVSKIKEDYMPESEDKFNYEKQENSKKLNKKKK